jgi:hypothetical protein
VKYECEIINCFKILERKSENKYSDGRPRHGCENVVCTDLKETVWEVVNWTPLAHDVCCEPRV